MLTKMAAVVAQALALRESHIEVASRALATQLDLVVLVENEILRQEGEARVFAVGTNEC